MQGLWAPCNGCKYTRSTPRGISVEIKRQALQLYLEGLGFRAIGRLLGVSNVAVLNGSGCLARKSSAPCSGRPQTRPATPHGHAGRDVALHPRQKNKCWLWISLCYLTGRILGVHVGGRGAEDLRNFLAAFPEAKGQITFTDDLAAYAAGLPEDAHFVGKMLTRKLESLNANVRHHPRGVRSHASLDEPDAPQNARAWHTSPRFCSWISTIIS